MKKYNFAVVGATGVVGEHFLRVMEEYNLPIDNLYLFASKKSAGKKLTFSGKEYTVLELTESSFKEHAVDIALFSAGGEVSKKFAPLAAGSGAVVIDNSAAWRMDKDVPLVVPEVNPEAIALYRNKNIIANPNCSTIQAMLVLKPIMDYCGIERVIYSTYQAVSGAGQGGIDDLTNGVDDFVNKRAQRPLKKFPHPIAFNCIPQIDSFIENGYTKEEMKMIDETRKILSVPDMKITATCVRVPIYNSHSESISVDTTRDFDMAELRKRIAAMPGVVIEDDPECGVYPMPINASGSDKVFVGRIRRDESTAHGVNMFVVSDNLRKGAATNAVQIAVKLIELKNKEA